MIDNATAVGWMIILTEFAIGIATLTGVALQLASLGGFLISITLWLTATWTVRPYFLGSDTAYAILWLALFFLVRQNTKGRHVTALIPNLRDRREVMRIFGVAAASVAAVFLGRRFPASNPTPEAGVFAYSSVCTHQGCTVNYDKTNNLLICPCHNAQFDPTSDGSVISGPTKIALPKIKVAILGINIVEI
jgi:thiosulfate dehydrogenase [quinone] large subunit